MNKEKQKQKSRTCSKEEARSLLTELMHKGFDTICSAEDKDGNLTVTWPASTKTGKQL